MSLTKAEELELIELLEQEERAQARKHHLYFMDYCWQKKSEPFVKGFHTEKICNRIDQAFDDFRNGKSSYLMINVHHRSGKTDILGRYLPPHFLGEFPECEIMSTSYQADFTQKATGYARNVFRSKEFQMLYPNIGLSKESNAKSYWEIINNKNGEPLSGKLYGSGLKSGIIGSGGHLVLCDDPLAGRQAAESITTRNTIWEAIKDDLLTRLAPVHIVILLFTRWHWDDPGGRIIEAMRKDSNFPNFEIMTFPAKASDYRGPGKYSGKYLFLERYPESWYITEYATLGRYSAAGLMDCDPSMRTGGVLSTNGIVYEPINLWPDIVSNRWMRVWDLAHTAKQRSSDDPDWTSGTLLHFKREPNDPVPHLYIRSVKRIREGATKRDQFIKAIVKSDGMYVKQAIENSIDSKDAYDYIVKAMPENSWVQINVPGDKLVKATPLEPIFEAPGHVHLPEGAGWIEDWLDELLKFDGLGDFHDDQIDNISAGYHQLIGGGLSMTEKRREEMKARRAMG